MISQQEFCLEVIKGLDEIGGEASIKSTKSSDPLRSLVKIDIVENIRYRDKGKLVARVRGLSLNSQQSVFEGECFDYDCFEDNGIWTTALKTRVVRVIDGVTKYWIRGDTDIDGNVYVVDIGTVYSITGEVIINEYNVPVFSSGIIKSTTELDIGIKFIVLKKVTPYNVEEVLYKYGELDEEKHLLRNITASLLDIKYTKQVTDIEEISITLVHLINSTYYKKEKYQKIYRSKRYKEPIVKKIIEDNLEILSRLVDLDLESLRYGSIPRYVATYSQHKDIYGLEADQKYLNKKLVCFEDNCFTKDCFREVDNELLVSRKVETRAVAWYLYALCTYTEATGSEKYKPLIEDITTCIISLKDNTNLFKDGWTHNDVYSKSEQVSTHSTSTAVMCILALLKAYNIEPKTIYIDTVCDVYERVINNLRFSSDSMFYHSHEDTRYSIESTYYGLLLSYCFDRGDIVTKSIKYLGSKLKIGIKDIELGVIQANNSEYIKVNNLEYIQGQGSQKLKKEANELLYFNTFTNKEAQEYKLIDALKYNTLIYSLIKSISEKGYPVPYFGLLNKQRQTLLKLQIEDREFISGIVAADCLLDKFIFKEEFAKIGNELVKQVKSLIFYRSYIYDKLKYYWPLDFSWTSKEALSLKGNLGRILYSISRVIGNWYIEWNRALESFNIKTVGHKDLERWSKDYRLEREPYEKEEDYKERLKEIVSRQLNTKAAIKDRLKKLEIEVEIEDTWKEIVRSSSVIEEAGNSKWGEGVYAGNEYASQSIIQIQTNQPIDNKVLKELENTLAAGIKYKIRESLSFSETDISSIKVGYKISEEYKNEVQRCPIIIGESNYNFRREDEGYICLEDTLFKSNILLLETRDKLLQETKNNIKLDEYV